MKILFIFISCLLLTSQLQAGELSKWEGAGSVYKWKDATGKINYSQYPPNNVKYEEVEPDYPTPLEGGAQAEGESAEGADNKVVDASKKAGDKSADAQTQEQKNCVTARGNLALLQKAASNLTYEDKEGKTVTIGKDQRASRIEVANKNVDFYCSK